MHTKENAETKVGSGSRSVVKWRYNKFKVGRIRKSTLEHCTPLISTNIKCASFAITVAGSPFNTDQEISLILLFPLEQKSTRLESCPWRSVLFVCLHFSNYKFTVWCRRVLKAHLICSRQFRSVKHDLQLFSDLQSSKIRHLIFSTTRPFREIDLQ